MPRSPTCYFAFAHAPEAPSLKYLKKESRSIRSALQSLHDRRVINLRHEESAEASYFFEDVSGLADRELIIFHFSGHGDTNALFAEDAAITPDSIAGLLAQKKDTLQLVFLNACSTAEQVQKLHSHGIKAVIATSEKVADKIAMEFSQAFYGALANEYDLEGAFLYATSFVRRVPEQGRFSAEIYRGVGMEESASTKLPWGLYLHPEAKGALSWELPKAQKISVLPSYNSYSEVNQGIDDVLNAMIEHQPALAHLEQDPKVTIVQNFPWVVSAHIRRLFANQAPMNQPSRARLRELIQAYVAGSRFLAFILLSQLWDIFQDETISCDTDWESLWGIDKDNYMRYDYIALLTRAFAIFEYLNISPFIAELESSVNRLKMDGASYEAYRFMESVRNRLLQDEISDDEVRSLCLETESCCTQFLCIITFLSRYRLLAVKDIRVIKTKHLQPTFNHRIFKWNVVDKSITSDKDLPFPDYTDSQSVLLVEKPRGREFERIQRFLNLSPFFIDKSTYFINKNQPHLPAIFALEYKGQEGLRYISVDHDINNEKMNKSDWIEVNRHTPEYQGVLELMNYFEKDLEKVALRSQYGDDMIK